VVAVDACNESAAEKRDTQGTQRGVSVLDRDSGFGIRDSKVRGSGFEGSGFGIRRFRIRGFGIRKFEGSNFPLWVASSRWGAIVNSVEGCARGRVGPDQRALLAC
jgi:hypothetical protein